MQSVLLPSDACDVEEFVFKKAAVRYVQAQIHTEKRDTINTGTYKYTFYVLA